MPENYFKGSFLASTLHEIRTPIQTIIGTLELLGDTKLDKEQLEYVRQIQFGTNVLLTIVNDVLDFSKLQSGKYNIETIPFNLTKLCEQVVDLITIEAHNQGLEIVTDIDYTLPKYIIGDPTCTQQILLNLIKNAVKFTPSGYVRIIIKSTDNGKYIKFQIEDSGIGIPEEKQQQIFNDFYQVDASTTRKYGGTGLGLAICQSLVKILGGKIGVKSNKNGGSIFWFTLPCLEAEGMPNLETPVYQQQDNILLVDDNELALQSLKNKLHSLGCKNIQTTTSGAEALEKLLDASKNNTPFSIAFIDMIMPVMDGWRLSSKITNDRRINNTKLYLVVPEGLMGADAKMKLLDWFNGYLYKPIKRNMLVSVLNDAIDVPIDLEVVEPNLETLEAVDEIPEDFLAKGLTCLVAEDHPINQKLIQTFLQSFGASVIIANDGQEVIDIYKKNTKIDIIFMDIQMPKKSGLEATEELRLIGFKGTIIACTANGDLSDREAYINGGMDDVLVKPFKKKHIQEIIEKWKQN